MFNNYDYSSSTRIDVVQQPNDAADAARLHGEIKKKAEEEILKSIRLDTNEFKGVLQMAKMAATQETMLQMVYSLNGKRIVTNHTHEPDYRIRLSEQDEKRAMIQGLITKMSEQIAEEILWPAMQPLINDRIL